MIRSPNTRPLGLLMLLLSMASCSQVNRGKTVFKRQTAAQTGIDFRNDITESDSVNLFVNEYAFMGGGVGIADFNNDGLPDIFFSGSQVSSRLYLNTGNNHFEDITQKAGVQTNTWCTGVSIVDINNDGFPDIYVCVSGNIPGQKRQNLLFINNRDLTFTESATAYGLAYSGYSTQAVFFDYDKDGDLDMYLLNHRLDAHRPNDIQPKDSSGNSQAADKLFRNEGIDPQTHHPVYKEVSASAGIKEDGYGLGVSVSDFNNDGWPDIYVCNDYLANDELWLNNQNGTFTNCISSSMKHQSYSSMGVDAADINNDGNIDLITLDMMPEYNSRKKTMFSFINYERYQMERDAGYQPEFMRNMLQLNNGTIKNGNSAVPFFSEIGQLAGVSETDWSWSVLFADFNNDGWKDIHITNGMGRDLTNEDFVQFRAEHFMVGNVDEPAKRRALMKKLAAYKTVPLRNYLFLNNHHLSFDDMQEASGIDINSISNGAAYADLDNDGDLDLVVNTINQQAPVFINTSSQPVNGHSPGYISFLLQGDRFNTAGIGTKISIFCKGELQVAEQYPVRGYLSSVDQKIHFGVGDHTLIDSVIVNWPDDRRQVLKNIRSNQTLTLSYQDAVSRKVPAPAARSPLFTEVTQQTAALFKHTETFFNDYSFQRLLTQKYSQLGPFLSTADINKDGLTDFFVGGAYNQSGKLFTQQKDGSFRSTDLVHEKKQAEDMGSLFFDADGDGDEDLIIAGGSDEFSPGSPVYIPRLFINDGRGNFTFKQEAIPANVNTSASVIAGADIDGDGDTDLFIAGRVSATFPIAPRSYILRNDHGRFTDVTAAVCPALQNPGMITAAVWADFDNDQQVDLVIAGEWMPLRFFKNNHGRFTEVTGSTGLDHTSGQWRSLIAVDMNKDGQIDFVAGNLGSNNKFHVTAQQPLQLFATDIDHNGSIDPILFYYIKDENGSRVLHPAISRDQFAEQVPSIKNKFLYYRDYAKAGFNDIFNKTQQASLLTLTCEETRSCLFENKGHGKFVMRPLPVEAQFAPVNAILCSDFDGDGVDDLLLAGNEYQADIMTGRYDASCGLLLKGDGKNNFQAITPAQSGFVVDGDVKDLKMIRSANGDQLVLVAVNDDRMRVFRVDKK